MSMANARKRELEYFRSTPDYANLSNVGTTFLADKLSKHLLNEIKKALPGIHASIKKE